MSINPYFALFAGSVAVASCSQILLKKGSLKGYQGFWHQYLNPHVLGGYGLLALSTLMAILAYRGMDYKNGPVIEALGYLFVMVLSALFLQEKITRKKLLGNILIVVGILVFYL